MLTDWFDEQHHPITRNTFVERERQAYWAQFGTFDETLAQLVATKNAADVIPISIWMRESALSRTAQTTIINGLVSAPYQFTYGERTPTLMASMTKRDLLLLQWDQRIDRIYAIQAIQPADTFGVAAPVAPSVISALNTEYIPPLWHAGLQGQGRKLGLLEMGRPRPMSGLTIVSQQPACTGLSISDHATAVANVMASSSAYLGVAHDAGVIAGCAVVEEDIESALTWMFDQGADATNISLSSEVSNQLGLSDRIVDYITRRDRRLIVVAAGNRGGFVGSPAKAWGALSVGGFEDMNSMTWNDDDMLDISGLPASPDIVSAWQNPTMGTMTWEKPEVSAVGVTTTYTNTGISAAWSGTSVAAPQVTGLAGLLIQAMPTLVDWPEATKAIIMASSVHNIADGIAINPAAGDLRDGAGGLVGVLAREVALTQGELGIFFPCSDSCWWSVETTANAFPVGGSTGGRIWAGTGDRVRAVVAWPANATANYHFGLETDLNLTVFDPDNAVVAVSSSINNSSEMVDFIAQKSGLYRIAVTNAATNETEIRFGIAALVYDQTPYLKNKVYAALTWKR